MSVLRRALLAWALALPIWAVLLVMSFSSRSFIQPVWAQDQLPTKPPVEAPTKPPLEPQPTKEQIQPTAVPATKESPPTEIPTKSSDEHSDKNAVAHGIAYEGSAAHQPADQAACADKHRDAVQCLGRFSGGRSRDPAHQSGSDPARDWCAAAESTGSWNAGLWNGGDCHGPRLRRRQRQRSA